MSEREKVLYEELRPDEFIERLNKLPIAYLPLGTLEWHGLHLPLGSDGIQSRGFFIRLAKRIGGIVLPMLFLGPDTKVNKEGLNYYGMDKFSFEDNFPQQLAGSAYWIDEGLFCNILDSILSNLKRAGFEIVVAHGHGPSTELFINNISQFEEKYDLKLFTLWQKSHVDEYGIQTDHAAANETSLVMALSPELVVMESIANDPRPVGIWGEDPRIKASGSMGEDIIRENLDIMQSKLLTVLSEIKINKRTISYDNVKTLIRK